MKVDPGKIRSVLERMHEEDQTQRQEGLSREQRWRSIPPETGQFLYQLCRILEPKTVVEIGMSHGYSTIWMALSATQSHGHVYSYEVEKWRYEKAVLNFEEAGVKDYITPTLVTPGPVDYPETIDFAFIDAEKEDYINHFVSIHPYLSPGSVVIADNTVSHSNELADYLHYVRNQAEYMSIAVPIGKGLEITRKINSEEQEISTLFT